VNLGVLIPCRDEAAVVERKLANLAGQSWPAGRHQVVVVDDGSADGTAALARERASALFRGSPVRVDVVPNDQRPGKAGAIRAGLAALEPAVDLVVLTDADVVLDDGALAHVASAFELDPALGMGCGEQRFVRDLAEDGRAWGGAGPPEPAAARYDRATAWVRRLESRSGRLFSVHGQLLAWRRALELVPTVGIAADDLDLRLAARRAGTDVRLIEGARFLEVKTARGPVSEAQALRRARAYLQVLRTAEPPPGASAWERAQLAFYRNVPGRAPQMVLGVLALALLGAAWLGGPGALGLLALLVGLAATSPPGREAAGLLRCIARAQREERRRPLSDRWEMQRS
jgi:GT2 family glycosyltransferase